MDRAGTDGYAREKIAALASAGNSAVARGRKAGWADGGGLRLPLPSRWAPLAAQGHQGKPVVERGNALVASGPSIF